MTDTDEREWRAQERAVRAERLGLDLTDDDARERRYRLIARTLRQPLSTTLPGDFASRIAAQATAPPAVAAASGRFESVLIAMLACALVVSAGVVFMRDGQAWLPAIRASLPVAQELRWLLALVGCLGVTWLLWQAPRRHLEGSASVRVR